MVALLAARRVHDRVAGWHEWMGTWGGGVLASREARGRKGSVPSRFSRCRSDSWRETCRMEEQALVCGGVRSSWSWTCFCRGWSEVSPQTRPFYVIIKAELLLARKDGCCV